MIGNQIIACSILLIILTMMIFLAIVTGETYLIIASAILGILTLLFVLQAIKIIKKSKGKKIKHDINYTVFIVIIILGTIFSILSAILIKNVNYRKNGVETTATVYNIEKKVEYNSNENEYQEKQETCEVYVTYEVDNKVYNNKLDMSNCNYSKGEKVNIYYQKDNPNKFINASKSNLIILIVGTIFCGFVLLYILYNLKKIGFKKAILNKKW